jgi:voltage-gated potassium channel Kch
VNAFPSDDIYTIYVTSFYWITQTVTVVGYGDISSRAPVEITLVVIWMLVGVGFYSFTIGNLTAILLSQDTSKEYEADIHIVDNLAA